MTEFNINDHVRVKLTPRGHALHRQHFAELGCLQYFAPEIDDEGWTRFQLWSLMSIFGQYMSCGGELVFETTIRMEGA